MTDLAASRPNPARWLGLALAAAVPVALAAAAGGAATTPNLPWYDGLARPSFNPPAWVFPVVWPLLYVGMAGAFYLVLRLAPGTPGRGRAAGLFLVQVALNGAWSWAFFGAQSPRLGLAVILALDLAVVLTIRAFAPLSRAAAWLLAPYLAWIAFATVLNGAIVVMNG